jgi:dynein heavy chain
LYITTPIYRPELPEEVRSRLNVIDFSLTRPGLEEQLLGLVVRQERSDMQQQKDSIVERTLTDKKELEDVQERMLEEICSTDGSLLDNEAMVNELYSMRSSEESITKRLQTAKVSLFEC